MPHSNRQFRILMIGWEFPPRISGGLGTACEGIVDNLLARGHEVTLVLPGYAEIKPRQNLQVINVLDKVAGTILPRPYSFGPYLTVQTAYRNAAGSGNPDPGNLLQVSEAAVSALQSNKSEDLRRGLAQYDGPASEKYRAPDAGVPGPYSGAYALQSRRVSDLKARMASYAAAVTELTDGLVFDVIHCHDWLTLGAGLRVKSMTGKPLIAHIHSIESERTGPFINADIREAERQGLAGADAIISVSRISRRNIMKEYGVPGPEIAVIHNGVTGAGRRTPRRSSPMIDIMAGEPRKKVLFLGRITWQKGPDLFLAAAERALVKLPETQFIMSGEGDMLNAMIEWVHRRSLEEHFIFPGFISHQDVGSLISACDLLVVSSRHEPFGIVALEAAQAGVAVVIPDTAGVGEVLVDTPVFPAGNPRALGNRIIELLKSPARRRRIIKKNKIRLHDAAWDKTVEQIEKVYRRLL